MDVLGQSSLLLAVVSLALGASTLARSVRNRLFIAYFVLCLILCGWSFSFFMSIYRGERDGTAYFFHLLLNIWLAPVGLIFIREFVRMRKGFSQLLFRVSLYSSPLLSIALVLGFTSIPWVKYSILFAPAVLAIQTLYLIWVDTRALAADRGTSKATGSLSPEKRIWIYLGALTVLCSSVMDHVPFLWRWVPAVGNVFLTVYLTLMSQAISQLRLLNLRALLSRILVLLFIALTLTGIYSLLFAWIPGKLALFFLNSFFVSFLLVMLLDPIRALIRYLISTLLTKEHRRLEQQVKELQRSLTSVVDLEPLFDRVGEALSQTLQPSRLGLFVLRSDQTRFRRVREEGMPNSPATEILAEHPLVAYASWLHHKGRVPIILDQVLESEMDRTTSRVEWQRLSSLVEGLRALEGNLLIPLIESDEVLGFVCCSVDSPPESWGGSWSLLAVLYPFFESAARTLRSMEVFDKQKEKERLAALGEMAAGLAHEIRNPLGAIKGAAQLLDSSSEKEENRFLKVIVEEVDRLNRVVTQFLDYSRRETLSLEYVDLSKLLARTLELLAPTLPKNLRIEFHPSLSGVRLKADPVKLHQLFLNLIQNSLQAMQVYDGKIGDHSLLSITVDAEAGSTSDVRVILEDSGPGIPKENFTKIFIPFFTTSPKGTGLGLSICQKIAESHGGRIEVASEEGKYARFTVYFPRSAS